MFKGKQPMIKAKTGFKTEPVITKYVVTYAAEEHKLLM
jgi:hypothetical protein